MGLTAEPAFNPNSSIPKGIPAPFILWVLLVTNTFVEIHNFPSYRELALHQNTTFATAPESFRQGSLITLKTTRSLATEVIRSFPKLSFVRFGWGAWLR